MEGVRSPVREREWEGGCRGSGDTGAAGGSTTDCLVYDKRVQVLPSRVKRKLVCARSSWSPGQMTS